MLQALMLLEDEYQASGKQTSESDFSVQMKLRSQKNRLHMGLREIESKDESICCTEKSDFEVYFNTKSLI